MKCNICNTDNRQEALFCKHCGAKLPIADNASFADPFASIVGKDDIKKSMNALAQTIREAQKKGANIKIGADCIIMGASGTGKTMLADAIVKLYYSCGLIKKAKPVVVDAVDWDEFAKNWNDSTKDLADGVLIVDNVQKLVKVDDSTDVGKLDKLFKAMDAWNGSPIVILIGLNTGLREYIDKSPEVVHRFEYFFKLQEQGAKELAAIILSDLAAKYMVPVDDASFGKLERVLKHIERNKPANWSNAHSAKRMAEEIHMRMLRRGGDSIMPEDIEGEEELDLTPKEILAKLDDFIGIDAIREEIENMISEIEDDKERFNKAPSIRSHFVFTGNPGTGKTTIARVFADVLKAMKVLPVGQLIEVDRSKLVSAYVGQTAIQTNEVIDKAMGGVLFIDEAYSLTNDGDGGGGFGKDAIDTLLKRLEDDRGKFVCVVAGYTKEMSDFIQANPGLQSRFNRTIEFADYSGADLTEMFRRMVKKNGFTLDEAADANLRNFFDIIVAGKTKNFGNAREVRNIFDKSKMRQSKRLRELRAQNAYSPEMAFVLTRDDIEGDASTREFNLDDVIAEMERSFVGMQSIKDAMRELGRTMEIDRKRLEKGIGQAKNLGVHFLLTGNPGTGKTTVARTLGKMLKAIHVLPTDNVIEVDKSQMVSQIVGETPKQVNRLVDRAMGGILFVDEAYTLSQDANSGANYGREAIETLMKRMEDDRGKFVCILAGYRDKMEEFTRVNSGINSRISHRLHIEDYTRDELLKILQLMLKKEQYVFTPDAEKAAEKAIDELVTAKTKDFGNAREVRKLYDAIKARQSTRLSKLTSAITTELLVTIEEEDIPVEQHKDIDCDQILASLDALVGLDKVKAEVRDLAEYLQVEKLRAEQTGKKFENPGDHYLFLGNPGTGKTTVARIMADIFLALGITKNTKFIEATYDTLVSKYRGETPEQTNRVIDSAMGGILFIDEAYTLNEGPNSPGQQAIDTLLKRMEDDRGKFVCIAAGYSREMSDFIASNSGLQSRFNVTLPFEDYDAKALAEIFRRKAKGKGYYFDDQTDAAMQALFEKIYAARTRNFGNAREVNNVYKLVTKRQGNRLKAMLRSNTRPSNDDLFRLIPEDFDIL